MISVASYYLAFTTCVCGLTTDQGHIRPDDYCKHQLTIPAERSMRTACFVELTPVIHAPQTNSSRIRFNGFFLKIQKRDFLRFFGLENESPSATDVLLLLLVLRLFHFKTDRRQKLAYI